MNTTPIHPLTSKDLLSVAELIAAEVQSLFATAKAVKADVSTFSAALRGKSIILIFEKPSLRTRVSFESGIARLGGHPIYFDHSTSKLGERESVYDYAKNLERLVDLIVFRTHAHEPLAELARHCRIPVVNALCERYHPCQALADLFTLHERVGNLKGFRLAYIGDGNNVCHSLMLLSATMGLNFTAISPKGDEPDSEVIAQAKRLARLSGGTVEITSELAAARNQQAIYTDTWVSMGDEAETMRRMKTFSAYQVNASLMAKAGKGAFFMHCLPAKRGQEVAAEVIDSPCSVVFDQAENRMHIQNALLLHMLSATKPGPKVKTRISSPPTRRAKPLSI